MVFFTKDAISDEPILGVFPTTAELGRQVKRLKTSTILNSHTETLQTVTDGVIGARFAKATYMAVEMAGGPENPGLIGALAATVDTALERACWPRGLIREAFDITITDACRPEGAFGGGAIRASEQRSAAWLSNGLIFKADGALEPLVGRDNEVPADFPSTYGDFADMTIRTMNSLLAHNELVATGSRSDKLKRLSAFCNAALPK